MCRSLYYCYHIMVGLGTIFIAMMGCRCSCSYGGASCLDPSRCCGFCMLAVPFPYIANTAGWLTAELGRQPWVICGLMRTADGHLAQVVPAAT